MSDSEGDYDTRDQDSVQSSTAGPNTKSFMYKIKSMKRRTIHTLKGTANKFEKTNDMEYDQLYNKFMEVDARTEKLASCLEAYIKAQEQFVRVGKDLADTMLEFYEGDPPLRSLAMAFQDTQKHLMQEVHPALATQWSEQVGTPAQRMLERFKAIKEDNGRRSRYMIDYDYYRNKASRLEEEPKTDKLIQRIKKCDANLQSSSSKYQKMNERLCARLRLADEHKAAMLDSALLAMVNLQKNLFQAGTYGLLAIHRNSQESGSQEIARNSAAMVQQLGFDEPLWMQEGSPRSEGLPSARSDPLLSARSDLGPSPRPDVATPLPPDSGNFQPQNLANRLGGMSVTEGGTMPNDGGASAGPPGGWGGSGPARDMSGQNKTVRVLYEYEASTETELDLKENDLVVVLKEDTSGWWQGELQGRIGWFPFNFVEVLNTPTVR